MRYPERLHRGAILVLRQYCGGMYRDCDFPVRIG